MNNPLFDVVPASARKYVYAFVALAALVWGVYEASQGDWKLFVGGLVTALVHTVAASNTVPTPVEDPSQVVVTGDEVDEVTATEDADPTL